MPYRDYKSVADFKAKIYAWIEHAINEHFLPSEDKTSCSVSIPSFNDVADISVKQRLENAQFIPIAQNGNAQAISLSQDNHVVDVDINFEPDPSYGPCQFVSAVAQFAPPLNWKPLRDTNASLMLRLISEDESVTSATIEVKATDRKEKCFEKAYCLEHGRQDVVIKLSDIKNPSLINEIVEICIVIRPNQVPSHKGHLRIDVMGLCD